MHVKIKATSILIVLFTTVLILVPLFSGTSSASDMTTHGDTVWENFKFVKNIMIWLMLMLVAFLMIFIKKYEWSVALAVLLSAAGSFVVYLAIHDILSGTAWDQDLLLGAVICSITIVIAIGCFLGTVKPWQYLLAGIMFAPVYVLIEWFIGNVMIFGSLAQDPGGSILVHMCAAYFGLGAAIALREKRAFDEPMHTTTHSVSFVWLSAMLLWALWPAFVTAFLPMDMVAWGMITCYMAGIGSVISAWAVCHIVQKRVNPLIYTYAMLAGPVAIGAPLLMVGPWGAILIGVIAGAVSALCFIYLHPWLCAKLRVLDVMGVHNLHGIGGWIGAVSSAVILLALGAPKAAAANITAAAAVFAVTLVLGMVAGFILRLTRGGIMCDHLFSDDAGFIKNEE